MPQKEPLVTDLPNGPDIHLRLLDSVRKMRAELAPIMDDRERLPYTLTVDLRVIELDLVGVENEICDIVTADQLEAMARRVDQLARVCVSFVKRVKYFEETGR